MLSLFFLPLLLVQNGVKILFDVIKNFLASPSQNDQPTDADTNLTRENHTIIVYFVGAIAHFCLHNSGYHSYFSVDVAKCDIFNVALLQYTSEKDQMKLKNSNLDLP